MRVPRWREASAAIKLGKPNSFWVLLSTWSFVHNHSGLRAVHLSAQCSIAVRAKACEIVTRGGGQLSWSGTVHTMWNRSANMAVWMNMKKWGRSSSDERSDKMGCMTKVLTFFFFQRPPPPIFFFLRNRSFAFWQRRGSEHSVQFQKDLDGDKQEEQSAENNAKYIN